MDEAAELIMWAWKDGEKEEAGQLKRHTSYGPSSGQEKQRMKNYDDDDVVLPRRAGAGPVVEASHASTEYALRHRKFD